MHDSARRSLDQCIWNAATVGRDGNDVYLQPTGELVATWPHRSNSSSRKARKQIALYWESNMRFSWNNTKIHLENPSSHSQQHYFYVIETIGGMAMAIIFLSGIIVNE